jgi:hypothetical protein
VLSCATRSLAVGGGTATVSGGPRKAAAAVYRLTLAVRNSYGPPTQAFTLTVTAAPAIQKIPLSRPGYAPSCG